MSHANRLAGLERVARHLLTEIQTLREEVERAERPAPLPVPPPAARPPLPAPPPEPDPVQWVPLFDKIDIEALVGRYGTLALATLTILLGLGAFLSWAVVHHLLGPVMRVSLGAMLALALATVGWRLRRKGAIAFGNALLGLALAAVHVDAWGAGPALHLISGSQALTIAALASIALAAFARLENDELLFSVGVGGALLAPFVTAVGPPQIIPLLAFGYVVLEVALTAIRDDAWLAPIYIVVLGCAIYVTAGLGAGKPLDPVTLAEAPGVFALAFAVAALFVPPRRHRVVLTQAALVLLALALLARLDERFAPVSVALAALGTAAAYGTLRVLTPPKADPWNVAAVLGIPMALMTLAMMATHDRTTAAWLGCGWTVAAGSMSVIDRSRRIEHTLVAAIASGAAILVGFAGIHDTTCAVALALHAIILTLLMRRERERMLMWVAAPSLALAAAFAVAVYGDLTPFQYVAFANSATLAGLAVSAAAVTFSYYTARAFQTTALHPLMGASGLIVPFLWFRAELAGAVSHDTAMFFLIAYYAIVGVAAVFVGRARAIPLLRHIGLGLAIYAALKAIAQASTLDIGLRVGSDFLAGLFMLAVAYWYRVRTAPR
jgi:uncharacterized membrane protein